MKSFRLLFDLCLTCFLYFFFSCSEEPIHTDLSNLDNNIDTLLITDISGYNYQISPEIGGYNKLYVGSKEDFTFLSSLFNFPSNSWGTFFDSTVTVDSIFFKVFSGDSLIENNPNLNLYFSTDSIFDESNSLVSELGNVVYDEWVNVGIPSVEVVIDTSCLLYTSPSPRDAHESRMPSSA